MSKIFFISDCHFSHKNILKYEDRPFNSIEEMNEKLIENWNSVVGSEDKIFILGDFSFDNKTNTLSILDRLNGKKFMIRGNHDYILDDKDISKKFQWIKDYHEIKYKGIKFILFHYPIQVFNCQHYGAIHLYGHVHSDKENHHPLLKNIKNAFNVGADVINFTPINIDEIINRIKEC